MKDLRWWTTRFEPQAENILNAVVWSELDYGGSMVRFIASEQSTSDPSRVFIHTFGTNGADYKVDDVRIFAERLLATCDKIEREVGGSPG